MKLTLSRSAGLSQIFWHPTPPSAAWSSFQEAPDLFEIGTHVLYPSLEAPAPHGGRMSLF